MAYAQALPVPSTTVELEFTAPAACADRNQFIDRVHVRSDRIQFASTADKQLTISVQGEDAKWNGEASFMEASREAVSRQITARSCDELVDGLALVTVMVLDPEAMLRTPVESAPVESAPSVPIGPNPPVKSVPVVPMPSYVPWHFAYGFELLASAISGPAPSTMFGYGASTHAEWSKARSALSPKLILGFNHSMRHQLGARGGVANLTLDSVMLAFCPLAIRHGSWGGRPCLAGSIGMLTAEGTRTFVPVTDKLTWAEAATRLELAWIPTPPVQLFIAPALGFALRRYSFSFMPYEFYQQPRVVVSGTAGVGLQFE